MPTTDTVFGIDAKFRAVRRWGYLSEVARQMRDFGFGAGFPMCTGKVIKAITLETPRMITFELVRAQDHPQR